MAFEKQYLVTTYLEIVNIFETIKNENNFKDFDSTIRVCDGVISVFDSLFYLLEDIQDIQNSQNIIANLLLFQNILAKGKVATLIHKSLLLGLNPKNMTKEDFKVIVDFGDKDIWIQLAKSEFLDDDLARYLLKENYLVLKNLLDNKKLSQDFKNKVFSYIKQLKDGKKIKSLLKKNMSK